MLRPTALFLLFALASGASAQSSSTAPLRATDLVSWTARVLPGEDAGEARFVTTAIIADGWRLYAAESPSGIPLTLTMGSLPQGIAARGGLRQTRPNERFDEVLNETYTYHTGTARVSQGLRVDRRASGRHRISANIRFAICNDSVCLTPATVPVRATFSVGN